jgi:hypothetical protein
MANEIPETLNDAGSDIVSITFKFEWRTIARIGLVWAAEYALLALIEDSPAAVKLATLVCALLALLTLQFEDRVRSLKRTLFRDVMFALGVIYSAFIVYAVVHVYDRESARRTAKELYVSSSEMMNRQLPVAADVPNGGSYDAKAVTQVADDAATWRKNTAEWLGKNLGEAARERFLDVSGFPSLCWGPKYQDQSCDLRYGQVMNRLVNDRKNLAAILETNAYDK